MKKTITFAQLLEIKTSKPKNIDRLAYRNQGTFDLTLVTYPTREKLAKAIRQEQDKPPSHRNLVPLVPLTPTEGY